MLSGTVHEIALALPHPAFPEADWGDTFEMRTNRHFDDAEHAARTIMNSLPAWASGLMDMRDRVVSPLGLKTGKAMMAAPDVECVGFFPVIAKSPDRILLGEDDRHLNFRVAVDLHADDQGQQVSLSTLVKRNNALGAGYLAVIIPFHKLIARAMLRSIR
ncbi:MAG: DUF2867 domain-containing protein [Rhizobiales bacterium]|nr:DUF2867 domain-containing protein [Hyphomicrobiales bacterium]MBO6700005.1 DUF2867 domain-containing protein [Hyphomicrobiales bacterium]MBO6737830.1 DUF2867 domain-containing protein [Hyphomicrobiales bacterium]MBO6913113.1 DUF2867 domain-containing protein [Hyphomicrobiales bacterium]MBO6957093.1 DUF2867 domain-containing protein [Hyphomicrobiales bacterium]